MEDQHAKKRTWRRKRRLVTCAASARVGRRHTSHGDTEAGPSADHDLQTSPMVDPEPGPSHSADSAPRASSFTEESSASDSESENEREESSTDDDDAVFGEEQAQVLFDDFMMSLPSLQRKTLAVLLMQNFQVRQKMSALDAAQEAASISGFNERTVRRYSKQFFDNRGKFPESRQGKHERQCLFNDEDLRLEAAMWVRENAYKKGEGNATAPSFCEWVNDCLLPSHNLSPELPRSISIRTATRWLSRLGFRPTSHKKGAFVDGHERDDVVMYRREFLRQLKDSHRPPPPCSDERAATPPLNAESMKKLVLIYHDESIFNTSEGQLWMWAAEDMAVLRPKTKGSGIMVSDFIDQHLGYLRLTEAEQSLATAADPSFPLEARALLEYGAEREGYWTGEKFMKNVEDAARIAEFKYPNDKHTVTWLFDHSSCHRAFADDALNAKQMNVRPGGRQPRMRDTTWAGQPQCLVDENGVPKGMKRVLEERGINTERMRADDMRIVLANHEDFHSETTLVESFLVRRGHIALFIPKFHCELKREGWVYNSASERPSADTRRARLGVAAELRMRIKAACLAHNMAANFK